MQKSVPYPFKICVSFVFFYFQDIFVESTLSYALAILTLFVAMKSEDVTFFLFI